MPDPNFVAMPGDRIVFMLVAKAANTSIKTAILQALGLPAERPHDAGLLRYVSKEEARQYPVRIAVVREPLDRLASCWRSKIAAQQDGRFLTGLSVLGLLPGMPFLQFVEAVALIPDAKAINAGQHFRSQAFDLCDGDEIIPTFIARFERLTHDWRRIQGIVMANRGPRLPDLPVVNQSNGPAPVYCPRGRAFALQRYRDDVRIFGYQPPRKFEIDPDAVTRGRSICNTLRETYQIARDRVDDPVVSARLRDLIAEAFDQGKRMNAKLGGSQYET